MAGTSNKFLTLADISYKSADVLSNAFGFTKTVNRNYDDRFARTGAKIGTTTAMRLPAKFNFTSGSAIAIQALNDADMPLTLTTLYQRAFAVDSVDMTMSMDDFAGRYLNPALISMAQQVDQDGLNTAVQYFNNAVGTVGTAPTTQATVNALAQAARTRLVQQLAPEGEEKHLLADPVFMSAGAQYNVNVFNNQGLVSDANEMGVLSSMLGFKWRESQLVPAHTVGTYGGSPVVTGTNQSGSSLITSGWTSGGTTLNAGDVFTIQNVYDVNDVTKVAYPYLKQFTVTQTVSDTSGAITIAISPAIVGPGDPRQNVSVLPTTSDTITVFGASAATTQYALAYHKNAIVFGTADLDIPMDGATGYRASVPELDLSVRVVKQFDIRSNQNLMRIDLLGGWAPLYPQLGVKLATS